MKYFDIDTTTLLYWVMVIMILTGTVSLFVYVGYREYQDHNYSEAVQQSEKIQNAEIDSGYDNSYGLYIGLPHEEHHARIPTYMIPPADYNVAIGDRAGQRIRVWKVKH